MSVGSNVVPSSQAVGALHVIVAAFVVFDVTRTFVGGLGVFTPAPVVNVAVYGAVNGRPGEQASFAPTLTVRVYGVVAWNAGGTTVTVWPPSNQMNGSPVVAAEKGIAGPGRPRVLG